MIKLFAWEPRMLEKLGQKREQELRKIQIGRIWDIAMFSLNDFIPMVASVATLAIYVNSLLLNMSHELC
jgi:hypothetical protein